MELANRISALDRLALRERFRDLAVTAIRMGHPDARWLIGVRPEDLDDAHLIEVVMGLDAWTAERPPLPVHPDSYAARHGD